MPRFQQRFSFVLRHSSLQSSRADGVPVGVVFYMESMLLEAFLSMRDRFAVRTAYRDYYENCRIGAFFFIYLTWLENGCRESPEELCALVRQIIKKTF